MPFYTDIPGGSFNIYDVAESYESDVVVITPANELFAANDTVPAGTPFTIGSTGATWRPIGSGNTDADQKLGDYDPSTPGVEFPAGEKNQWVFFTADGTVSGVTVADGDVWRCTADGTSANTPGAWAKDFALTQVMAADVALTADVVAGTDNMKTITPLRLREEFDRQRPARVFTPAAAVTVVSAGEPTPAEIKTYNDALPTSHVDTFLVYNGTNSESDTPTYLFHVDKDGDVTLVAKPSDPAKARVFFTATSVGAVDVANPTEAEVQTFVSGTGGAQADRLALYNGTDTNDGTHTHLYWVDSSSFVTEIASPAEPSALQPQTLTDAAGTITWDTSLGAYAELSVGGSGREVTATNLEAGKFYALKVSGSSDFELASMFKRHTGQSMSGYSPSPIGETFLQFFSPDGTDLISLSDPGVSSGGGYTAGSMVVDTDDGSARLSANGQSTFFPLLVANSYSAALETGYTNEDVASLNFFPRARITWIASDDTDRTALGATGFNSDEHTPYMVKFRNAGTAPVTFTLPAEMRKSDGVAPVGAVTVPAGESHWHLFYGSYESGSPTLRRMFPVDAPASSTIADLFDSSAAADAKTLPAATGSGAVLFYANKDVTANDATLAPAAGESINDLDADALFYASNYVDNTTFKATDVAPGVWSVEVDGAPASVSLARASWARTDADGVQLITPVAVDYAAATKMDLSTGTSVLDSTGSMIDTVNDQIVLPNDGDYFISVTYHLTDSGTDSSTCHVGIGDGTNPLQRSEELMGTSDQSSAAVSYTGSFAANDTIDVRAWHALGENFEVSTMTITVLQLPSTETVLAGHVTPQPLDRFMRSRSNFLTSALWDTVGTPLDATVLDVVDVAPSTSNIVDNGDGTVTLKAGSSYKLTANVLYFAESTADTSDTFYQWYDGSAYVGSKGASVGRSDSGVGFAPAIHFTGSLGADTTFSVRNSDVDNSGNAFIAGTKIVVEMVPESSVVMPDAVPVGDNAVLLGSFANLADGVDTDTFDISENWGDLEGLGYEYVEFRLRFGGSTEGSKSTRSVQRIATKNWLDCELEPIFHGANTAQLHQISGMAPTSTQGSLTLTGLNTAWSVDLEVYGIKAQKTVINTRDVPVDNTGVQVGDLLEWTGTQYVPSPLNREQDLGSTTGTIAVDASAGRIVFGTMDTAAVTLDPVTNLTRGTVLMRLTASGAARDLDLAAAIKRPEALSLPLTVPDGQSAVVTIATINSVQTANLQLEAV